MFALAPKVCRAWQALSKAVREGMDERHYELVTGTAAGALGARYCLLTHPDVLHRRHFDADRVHRLGTDHRHAELAAEDVAVIDFAARVATDPGAASATDVDHLRCGRPVRP